MDQFFVSERIRIRPRQITHIRRFLPSAITRMNVKIGDEVAPNEVLAEGKISVGFRVVNLAKELDVSPKEAPEYLKRDLGKNIFKDELLASKKGIFGLSEKIILSPDDGILEFYDEKTGALRIKLFPKTVKLACGVWGIVDDIDEGKGQVIIRTAANFIFGVLGSGKEREGTLNVIGSKEVLIGSRQLEETMRGQIIVGGSVIFEDGLEKANELGIAGIISGGIDAKNYKSIAGGWNIDHKHFADIGFSVVVTEGFGSVPIGDDVFDFMQKSHGSFSILDGNRNTLILPCVEQNCMIDIRKTKLPPGLFVESAPEPVVVPLKLKQKVRIIGADNFGEQGMVESIDKMPTKMQSGITSTMVTVVNKSKKMRVCYQNLEAI